MKVVGIKRVYYSVKPNMIVCERVNNMISIQASNVCKLLLRKYNQAPKTDNEFFKKLLITLFPNYIKRINLDYFLKHNFKIVLPLYRHTIIKNKTMYKVVFFDDTNCIICEATIKD